MCELGLELEHLYANEYAALKVGNKDKALRWLEKAGDIKRQLREAISNANKVGG